MTCPKCRADVGESSVCDGCGLRLLRSVAGVMKTSAVLIAAGGKETFYSSVHEVPGPLRVRLEKATNGSNSGTILIADKAGRERIQARADAAPGAELPKANTAALREVRPEWVLWAGLALLVVAIIIIVMVWGKWPNG